jgi:magnesium transporter
LKALKFDPALGSGIIVTGLTDAFGFLSFLGLASYFRRYLV